MARPAPEPNAASAKGFDAAYYRRFYDGGLVHDEVRIGELMSGILGLAAWWEIPVRSVLDVGAGLGFVGSWLAANHPAVAYLGVDLSEWACREHGHRRADIASWRPRRAHDLTMCISVLQYVPDDRFDDAVANLAAGTRHLLYLELPTRRDRTQVIDPTRTDLDVHWRSGAWYRRRLAPWFEPIGAGLWHRPGAAVPFFELEAPGQGTRPR